MKSPQAIHNIISIELDKRRYSSAKENSPEYWNRTLTIKHLDFDGHVHIEQFNLFADDSAFLMIKDGDQE